jgi:hypothetical protein
LCTSDLEVQLVRTDLELVAALTDLELQVALTDLELPAALTVLELVVVVSVVGPKCGLIPGRDFGDYTVYGAVLPPADQYDSICSRCWKERL